MGKPIQDLEVEIYQWPTQFLVEAERPDRDYTYFYPNAPIEIYPHFVDLEVYETGWCSCRDFRFQVEPFIFWNHVHRRECIHLIAAKRYLNRIGSQPQPMSTIQLFL